MRFRSDLNFSYPSRVMGMRSGAIVLQLLTKHLVSVCPKRGQDPCIRSKNKNLHAIEGSCPLFGQTLAGSNLRRPAMATAGHKATNPAVTPRRRSRVIPGSG